MTKPTKTPFWIYYLRDPKTQAIRYVGRSRDPIRRLNAHLNHEQANKKKWEWILSLKKEGLHPEMVFVESVFSMGKAKTREAHHIRKNRSPLLLNIQGAAHSETRFQIRMSPEEMDILRAMAKKEGYNNNVSELVRDRLFKEQE